MRGFFQPWHLVFSSRPGSIVTADDQVIVKDNSDVFHTISEQAGLELARLCQPFLIDSAHQIVRAGHPAAAIRSAAEEFGCDLVVLGTHGRRGWRRVLGSTAGELLHGAGFDVYMSKVPEVTEQPDKPAALAELEKAE